MIIDMGYGVRGLVGVCGLVVIVILFEKFCVFVCRYDLIKFVFIVVFYFKWYGVVNVIFGCVCMLFV